VELARYVVDAVVVEGRSYREVAPAHGVSKSWVAELVARYRSGGYEALAARSKAAHRIAHRTSAEIEDKIVLLRKELEGQGFDAGAQTIHTRSHRRSRGAASEGIHDRTPFPWRSYQSVTQRALLTRS
jgi:transposase